MGDILPEFVTEATRRRRTPPTRATQAQAKRPAEDRFPGGPPGAEQSRNQNPDEQPDDRVNDEDLDEGKGLVRSTIFHDSAFTHEQFSALRA